MKHFLLSIFNMIFFSGCAVSSLSISDTHKLSLEHDKKHIEIAKSVLESKGQWYNYINISQYKLKSKEGILLYEYIEIDSDWEFIFGPIVTLEYLLDAFHANILYKDSAISLVQLEVSQTQHINILIQSSGFFDMGYVYGFSDSEFLDLANSLGGIYTKADLKKDTSPRLFQSDAAHMSKWSVTMLFLRPLIKLSFRQVSNY